MSNFEKAVRYFVVFEADDNEEKISRYTMIEKMARDNELVEKYAKMYDKLLDMLLS